MAQKKKKDAKKDPNNAIIAQNKKARHNYNIVDTYEAGIVLLGTEVKSLRDGGASIVDGFCQVTDNELWLEGIHIAEYGYGTWTNHAARRRRKLLLHRSEINKLAQKLKETGYTVVPLSCTSRMVVRRLRLLWRPVSVSMISVRLCVSVRMTWRRAAQCVTVTSARAEATAGCTAGSVTACRGGARFLAYNG